MSGDMFYNAIWEMLADGHSVDDIKSAIELLDSSLVDEVNEDFEEEKTIPNNLDLVDSSIVLRCAFPIFPKPIRRRFDITV